MLIEKTKNFDSENKYPLLLFLHGAGTRGNDISKLCDNPFFKVTERHQNFPFVTVAPLCEENTWFDIWERLKTVIMRGSIPTLILKVFLNYFNIKTGIIRTIMMRTANQRFTVDIKSYIRGLTYLSKIKE